MLRIFRKEAVRRNDRLAVPSVKEKAAIKDGPFTFPPKDAIIRKIKMGARGEWLINRQELTQYITEVYNVDGECPWEDPEHMVFRHRGNRKWFALILDAPRHSLGLPEEGRLDVLNVKCGPVLSGALRGEPGIFPAYHMNKSHWVSIALDGSADQEQLKLLLDTSFELTAPKPKKRPKLPDKEEDSHGF